MAIKVYYSSMSGNMEIKKHQDMVVQILESHKIEFEKVDITDPTNEEEKLFMRENSKPKDGQSVPLPPQIFNDKQYCGDFDALDDANECDDVLGFLKLAEPKSASQTITEFEQDTTDNTFQATPVAPSSDVTPTAQTTVVSTLTLGSLAQRKEGEADSEEAPPIPERAAVKKEFRKSQHHEEYENVVLEPSGNDKDNDEDSLSLHDSIEDNQEP